MTIRERIAIALERSKKSQRDLARAMGLTSPTVSSMLSKDEIDSIKYLKAVEELTGYRFEWLRMGSGPEKSTTTSLAEEPNEIYWNDKLKTKDELIEELRRRISDMANYKMSFCEMLEANHIDADKFIAFQNEFIAHCRHTADAGTDTEGYRGYLEKDQALTMIEKFVNRLERERLQQKNLTGNEKQSI
jgi:transcriptional regulator with XRE-family HTH domain